MNTRFKKEEGNVLDVTWNLAFVSDDGKIEKTGLVFQQVALMAAEERTVYFSDL